MKEIAYTIAARKSFRKLPIDLQARLADKLAHYAQSGGGDVIALHGEPGSRMRIGDFRVIFVETDAIIEVRAVGHRRDIYR